jgi:hypothetical protein
VEGCEEVLRVLRSGLFNVMVWGRPILKFWRPPSRPALFRFNCLTSYPGQATFASTGAIPKETAVVWYRSGVIPPAGVYNNYWTDPFSLFFLEIVAVQFAELKRLQDYR